MFFLLNLDKHYNAMSFLLFQFWIPEMGFLNQTHWTAFKLKNGKVTFWQSVSDQPGVQEYK